MNSLLDVANWPAAMRAIDNTNPVEYDFWANQGPQEAVLDQIHTLELIAGGMFYIDHRGYAIWESAAHRSLHTVAATFNDIMIDIPYELDRNQIYNEIRVTCAPPQEAAEDPLNPGTPLEREWRRYYYLTIQDGFPHHCLAYTDGEELASSWGTPVVYATLGSGGADISSQITIYKERESAVECYIHFEAEGPDHPYVIYISVTYTVLTETTPEGDSSYSGGWAEGNYSILVQDETSAKLYTNGVYRTKEIYIPFPLTYEQAEALANFYLSYFKDPVPDISMSLINRNATELVDILSLHISDLLTVENTKLGMSTNCFINKESHRVSSAGSVHEVTWKLEKETSQRKIFIWDTSIWNEGSVWGF